MKFQNETQSIPNSSQFSKAFLLIVTMRLGGWLGGKGESTFETLEDHA